MKKIISIVLTLFVAVSAFAQITAIRDVQYTTNASGDSPLNGQTVTISGIVTAEPYAYNNKYFFIQDKNEPWSGICVYAGAPDDLLISEGDSITITGTVEEKYGLTRLSNPTSIVIEKEGVFGIDPLVVTANMINTGSPTAESYEGVLVRIKNVTIANPNVGYGEWSVSDETGTVIIDNGDYYFWPEEYVNVLSITGPLFYDFNNFKIAPRLAYDIVEGKKIGENKIYTRIQRIQQVRYSDLVKTGFDGVSDYSYLVREEGDDTLLTVRGVVTMPTGISYAGAGVKFILSEKKGGPWSAILSYNQDSTIYPVLFQGDEIEMTGYVGEYTTAPSNMTEFWLVGDINILNFEQPLPDTPLVKTGDLRWPTTAEQWGNVFVRAENAVVTKNVLQYEEMEIDDGSGGVLVDDDSDSLRAFIPPPIGTTIVSIVGWIYHHYGFYQDSSTYKIEPLYERDIVAGEGPPLLISHSRNPMIPQSTESATVSFQAVTPRNIAEAKIFYRLNNTGTYSELVMTEGENKFFSVEIPPQVENTFVDYYFYVKDEFDGVSYYPSEYKTENFSYVVLNRNPQIRDIQYTHWANGMSPLRDATVTVTGYITAGIDFVINFTDSDVTALPMADESGTWNSIYILGTPDQLSNLSYGQKVTVTGKVDENYDNYWRWSGNTYLVVDSLHAGEISQPPAASRVSIATIAANHEAYEGVEVNLTGMLIVESINQYDITIKDVESGATLLLDDDCVASNVFNVVSYNYATIQEDTLRPGNELLIVNGVYMYSYNTYKIEVRDATDLGGISAIEPIIPTTYALHQNYPNPFNPSTTISFDLPDYNLVEINVYNVKGQLVQTLVNNTMYVPGHHTIRWYPSNLSSGIYLYQIQAGDFKATKKMTYLK